MTSIRPDLLSALRGMGIGTIRGATPVSGGDINQAFCLVGQEKFFLKINSAKPFPTLFEMEANGLMALNGLSHCQVPEVIHHGRVGDTQFLLLQWIEQGLATRNFWEIFGTAVAQLHGRTQPNFGYHADNYIGSLHQPNGEVRTWGEFYRDQRVMPLLRQLQYNRLVDSRTVLMAERIRFDELFPKEPPSLLHGDLWSGNFMAAANGRPCIYDPAVYYGHREMDLGMTKLFGGFDQRFYDAYNETFPLEKDWEKRITLTQLYPLLVHAILFGGHYVGQVGSIISKFG